jgi:hypothetical protein
MVLVEWHGCQWHGNTAWQLKWVEESAGIILENKTKRTKDSVKKFIKDMGESGKLRIPGFYRAAQVRTSIALLSRPINT